MLKPTLPAGEGWREGYSKGQTLDDGSPELERAVAAMVANVDRLDELGLETVEPATTFGWPSGEVTWPATPNSTP